MADVAKKDFELIVKIAKRAGNMGLLAESRITVIMDLEYAHKEFNLRLKELLEADDFNFSHDIVGIQNNMNRQTGKVENYFLPRYANPRGK